MRLLSIAVAAAVIGLSGAAQANVFAWPFGADDTDQGVMCEVNKVSLHAKDAADCTKAGGKVTHMLKTVKTEKK